MLQEAGAEVRSYDPFFHPDESVFSGIYDCIVMVEVIEHLHHPRQELLRLKSLLSPQGFFAIQTKYHSGLNQEFANWGYRRDPTHVAFFSLSTMQFVANLLAAPVVTREDILQPRNWDANEFWVFYNRSSIYERGDRSNWVDRELYREFA